MGLRLFCAIELPDSMVDAVSSYERQQRHRWPNARWVEPGNLHITVSFFGNVQEAGLPELRSRLAGLTAGFHPLGMRYRRLRLAPPAKPQRSMIWAEFAPDPEFNRLSLEAREAAVGLAPNLPSAKPAHAHVTLARLKRPVRPGQVELAPLDLKPERFIADSLALFESRLLPDGPEYRLIERFPFAG